MKSKRQSKDLSKKPFKKLCQYFECIPNCLELKNSGIRGVKAKCSIEKGKQIIQVPYKYFINDNTTSYKFSPLLLYLKILYHILKEYEISSNTKKKLQSIKITLQYTTNNFIKLLYLLQLRYLHFQQPEAKVRRAHRHYISILPKDFDYHPLSNPNESKKRLSAKKADIMDLYEKLNDLITLSFDNRTFKNFLKYKGMENLYQQYRLMFSYENIFWASLVIRTRSFSASGLIPLLDMFNHSKHQNAKWNFDQKTYKTKLIAKTNLKRGQEIFVNYGINHNKEDLFVIYGF